MAQYRYLFRHLIELGFPETAIIRFVEAGILRPEDWDQYTETEKKEKLAERSLTFLAPDVEHFFKTLALIGTQFFQILEQQTEISRKLDALTYAVKHTEEMLINLNQRLTLRQFAAETGYDYKYVVNKVVKLNEYSGFLNIPGFKIPLIKLGGKWRMSRLDFMERWNKINYEIWQQIQKHKAKR